MTLTDSDRATLAIDPSRLLVVIAPHPDDEVIGFGGAIYDHVAHGGRTLIVAVTDGGAFDDERDPTERRDAEARRREEQSAALAVLGVDQAAIVRVGLPDGRVADFGDELAAYLHGLLFSLATESSPLVVVPYRNDGHLDHEACAQAALSLEGLETWEVPIWSWRRRSEFSWTECDLPLSPEARAAKRAALGCHRSQLEPLPGGRPAILSAGFVRDFDRAAEVVVR